jgi:hypothetical protein
MPLALLILTLLAQAWGTAVVTLTSSDVADRGTAATVLHDGTPWPPN